MHTPAVEHFSLFFLYIGMRRAFVGMLSESANMLLSL